MLRRIWAMTQKEFIQLVRMRVVLPALILGPVLELALFGAAIHTDVTHISMVVADQSQSAASRAYVNAFVQSGSFDIVGRAADEAGVERAIDGGQASLGIVIPQDFEARGAAGAANVLLLVDGSSAFVAQAATGSATAISQQFGASLAQRQVAGVNAHFQVLYNPELKDLSFIVPGFSAFLLYGLVLKLTAFAVVREREVGTIEALLVTPLRPIELLLAKTIPNLCIGLVDTAVVLPVGILVFGVQFRGSLLLFGCLAILFACSGLGLGLAVSAISQNQLQANQISSLLNIAGMFLSGFMFPAYALPWLLRVAGAALPLTHFIPIINGVFIKGVGLNYLLGPVLMLAALTGVIFFAGARFFRQQLD